MMEGLRGRLMGPENTHHTPKGQQLSQREEEIMQTREIWLLLWVKPQKLCEASPSFLFLSFCPHTSYAIQAWEQWTEHSWAWEGSSQREISAKEQTLGQLQAGEQVIAQFWCFVLSTCSALIRILCISGLMLHAKNGQQVGKPTPLFPWSPQTDKAH